MLLKVLNNIQAGGLNLFKEIKMVYKETFPLVATEECTNKTTSEQNIIDLLRDLREIVVTVSVFYKQLQHFCFGRTDRLI